MVELTESPRKAVIEAVTDAYGGWDNAWEQATEMERKIARRAFLAGVLWAQEQREAEGNAGER